MTRIMQICLLAFVAFVSAIGGFLSFTTSAWAPTAVEYNSQIHVQPPKITPGNVGSKNLQFGVGRGIKSGSGSVAGTGGSGAGKADRASPIFNKQQ
jgi:hypothetical protein